jgi:hypothetical protein
MHRSQPLNGLGLLNGGQILPQQVFDDGYLGRFAVGDNGRDRRQSGILRRLIAALTGDDDKQTIRPLPHQDRLQDPMAGYGGGQLGQGLFVEILARLLRVRLHRRQRQFV